MIVVPELSVLIALKYLFLKDYLLIKNKTSLFYIFSNEKIKLIGKIFYKIYKLSINILYIIIQCHKLLKKPQSLTIRGMSLWIINNTIKTFEIKNRHRYASPIIKHLLLSTIISFTEQYFNLIAQYFLNRLDVIISKIIWNKI